MWKCVGPSGLLMCVCLDETAVELGRLCYSPNCRPETSSFAFVSTATLLHAHIRSDNTVLLLQLPAANSFSRINVRSTISKVLDKWLEFLLKGDFDKPWALMNAVTRARPLASGGAEGHWLAGPSGHHCDVVTLPQSAARSRAHTSCCCLVAQSCPTLCDLLD